MADPTPGERAEFVVSRSDGGANCSSSQLEYNIEQQIHAAIEVEATRWRTRINDLELQLAGQKLETTVAIVEQTHMLPHIPEEDLYDGT